MRERISAKTIQIFLPDGDPRGIRVAEITTRIVRVIEVPRNLLENFLEMPEAKQVGVYFLFGADVDDDSIVSLYIGQTGGVGDRLSQHGKEKIFWNRALIVVSLTNSLTQTHALFLEWQAIKESREIGRYTLLNGNAGNRPHTPPPLQADCHEIFETAATLLATLGYPVFEPVLKGKGQARTEEVYLCESRDAKGRGIYTEEGFVVLEGSSGRRANVQSIKGTSDERFRDGLIQQGILRPDGDMLIFTKDHLFKSPSMAAVALLGRTANGWLEWRTADGKLLDSLRKAMPANSFDLRVTQP